MKSFFVGLFVLICSQHILANNFIQVNSTNQFFIDAQGNTRIFHGVNAVYKVPPYYPELTGWNPTLSLSATDMQQLQEWGFNAIRLGVIWAGVEPEKNQYNATYLNIMYNLVEQLGSYGIYSIIDCHQDVFSRQWCGEGVPLWATPNRPSPFPFPEPAHFPKFENNKTTGVPNFNQCIEHKFSSYYFSGDVSESFQHLYNNTDGLQDYFVGYWKQVVQTFKNSSYVLGYELINEPWCGDYLKHPELILLPGKADAENLAPLYSNLNDNIRQVDNDHIIFFESAISDISWTGLTSGPGGPSYDNRQAYSYHVYCGDTDSDGNPQRGFMCNFTQGYTFDNKMHDFKKLQCGGMMTEFGAVSGFEQSGIDTIDDVLGQADKHIQSWSYWQYKCYKDITTASQDCAEGFYTSNGTLDVNKVIALTRTYAPIIAGVPTVHEFDPITSVFELQYIPSTITNQTTIYANQKYHYPNGYQITVSPSSLVKYTVKGQNILVQHSSSSPPSSVLVVVVPN